MGVRRRVRGIAVRVAVFLLLGAVVNVAINFGVLVRIGRDVTHWVSVSDAQELSLPIAQRMESGEVTLEWSPTIGVDWFQYLDHSEFGPSIPIAEIVAVYGRSGWPCRSFEGGYYINPDTRQTIVLNAFVPQTDSQRTLWPVDVLPLRPIWPGFAINTLFYAAILWLLFAAPGRVRRWRRIRRGLCAKCAYPVGTSDVCTECGAAILFRPKACTGVAGGCDL